MTREEQTRYDNDCQESDTAYASGYNNGITASVRRADAHPVADFRERCCDLMRNTVMPEDLRSHLINSIMRM